jgi:hypothetical protein
VFTYASAQRIFCCAVAALLLCVTHAISLFAFAGFSKDGLLEDGGDCPCQPPQGLQCIPRRRLRENAKNCLLRASKERSQQWWQVTVVRDGVVLTRFHSKSGYRICERAEVLRVARERNRQKDCNRSSCEYLFQIHSSLPDLQIPAAGKLRRFRPMRPVVALTDKANGCGVRNVQLFRLDPNPKLFAYHHSQESEQGDDGRRRTLHPDQTVQNPYTQTNYKGYEQDFHRIPPA